ncbi:MAG TPA: GntR family transcriptional regulator [Mycobacteriales bacterium]|nr:GntR family transcriptional regulator [Mycobacteriales bacterium]
MTGPRFTRVAGELRERIALGDYGDTGALESEAELGRRYGVSRITVRRALEQLRDEGLVSSRKGAGWYVAGGTIHQPIALGTFQHAASAVTEAGLKLRRRVVEFGFLAVPVDIADTLGLAADAEALRVRSVRSADLTPLDAVTEWIPAAVAAHVSRADAEEIGIWETLRRHGTRIATVRQSITAVAATEDIAALLGVSTGVPLLLVRRIAVGADRTPLALSNHRYIGHRFQLDVEFRGWPGTAATEPPGLNLGET